LKRFLFGLIALVLISSLLLAGCNGDETTTTTSPTATTTTTKTTATTTTKTTVPTTPTITPEVGGVLQLAGSGNIANLGDPDTLSNPGDAMYAFPVVEPLFTVDKGGNLQPWLVESYEIADDGSHVMLYLRQGVTFHDGEPFNAESCKYNLDKAINSTVWINMKSAESAEIIGEYTIKLNFRGGKFDWLAMKSLAGFWSCCMFSPKALEENPTEWKRTHVVGTGPFILTEFERDSYLYYERNEDYWRGAPYLDGVKYNIIPDTTVQLLSYKSGELHTIGVQASDAQDLIDSGFEIVESTDMILNMCLIPSSGNPDSPLADIRIRRAVEHAIDKQALADGLTYGYGRPSYQHFPEFLPYYNPEIVGYHYDVERAKELLDEAGYPSGITITLHMADFVPLDTPMAIQDQLKLANINLEFNLISILQLNEMIGTTGTGWEGYMYSYGFPGTTVDPASAYANGSLNAQKQPDGTWVPTTWCSCEQPAELCELAARAAGEIDVEERIKLYQELDKKSVDEYAHWLWLYWTPTLSSVSPKLKGHTIGKYTEPWPYAFSWIEK